MKQIILIICVQFFCSLTFSQDILGKYSASQLINNKIEGGELSSFIMDSQDELYIEVDLTNVNTIIGLSNENRNLVRQYIEKYYEWAKKSDSAKISAEKKIGTIFCKAGFKNSSGWHFSDNVEIEFKFYSMKAPTGTIKCELTINIPSMIANDNQFIKTSFKQLWLSKVNCKQLTEAISENLINKRGQKIKIQDEILK